MPEEGLEIATLFGYGTSDVPYSENWGEPDGLFDINSIGDNVFLYCLNSNGEPYFLHAFTFNGPFIETEEEFAEYVLNGTETSVTMLPPNLMDEVGTISLPTRHNFIYNGTNSNSLSEEEIQEAFQNPSNYRSSEVERFGFVDPKGSGATTRAYFVSYFGALVAFLIMLLPSNR
jgi:hypothetical protein